MEHRQHASPPAPIPGPARCALRAAPLLLAACSALGTPSPPPADPCPEAQIPRVRHAEVYERAEEERSRFFEGEVERLRADLREAEASIVALESGLRGSNTRADAVSALAEARIALERARRGAPWREARAEEARAKLAEAERQLEAGHVGSAVFFASRAQRVAEALVAEARAVARDPKARFVRSDRANLREGPSTRHRVVAVLPEGTPVFPERGEARWTLVRTTSGGVGWVHASLLEKP